MIFLQLFKLLVESRFKFLLVPFPIILRLHIERQICQCWSLRLVDENYPKAYLALYLCKLETALRESQNSERILEDLLNIL